MSLRDLIQTQSDEVANVRAVVVRAPSGIGSTIRVTVPSFDADRFFEVDHWDPRGSALPAVGDEGLLSFDERGEPWLRWDGGFRLLTAGTSLPASPADGDIFVFDADPASGVKWMFQYRAAGASGKRWEFIGGSPLVVADDDARSSTSTSFANLPTDPMSLTLPPLAGDYDVEIQADIYNATAGFAALLSFAVSGVNGGAASDDWAAREANTVTEVSAAKRTRLIGVSAGATVAEKARATGGTANFSRRRIMVWPVRVG